MNRRKLATDQAANRRRTPGAGLIESVPDGHELVDERCQQYPVPIVASVRGLRLATDRGPIEQSNCRAAACRWARRSLQRARTTFPNAPFGQTAEGRHKTSPYESTAMYGVAR